MYEESAAWSVSDPSTGDIVQDAIKKEKAVQWVLLPFIRCFQYS